MEQIPKNKLCYYCMGCNQQGNSDYKPVNRCNDFMAGIENWQEKLREEQKNECTNKLQR